MKSLQDRFPPINVATDAQLKSSSRYETKIARKPEIARYKEANRVEWMRLAELTNRQIVDERLALILDGKDMLLARKLICSGFRCIDIPNYEAGDMANHPDYKKYLSPFVTLYGASFEDYVMHHPKNAHSGFSCIIVDACGICGDEMLAAIQMLFEKQLIYPLATSFLSFTFYGAREPKKNRPIMIEGVTKPEVLRGKLRTFAAKAGYQIISSEYLDFHRTDHGLYTVNVFVSQQSDVGDKELVQEMELIAKTRHFNVIDLPQQRVDSPPKRAKIVNLELDLNHENWWQRTYGNCRIPVKIIEDRGNGRVRVELCDIQDDQVKVVVENKDNDDEFIPKSHVVLETTLVESHNNRPEFLLEEIIEVAWKEYPKQFCRWRKARITSMTRTAIYVEYERGYPQREWVSRKSCRQFMENNRPE